MSYKTQTYPAQLMEQFRAVQREDKQWAIELEPGRFLHWIESTNNKAVTSSRADMALQSWPFREMAEHMIGYLKILWNEDRAIRETADDYPTTVECQIPMEETNE
jgi:hypothetical protein